MKNITQSFGKAYAPVKAFVVYKKHKGDGIYVESYDMDANGFPINAHPLSGKETAGLANALDTSGELRRNFLKPSGLLPKNVVYINPDHDGYAVWHTPKQAVDLFFIERLGIPCGKAEVPPLVWKASKSTLYIYAVENDEDISEATPLCLAPFFNIYPDGRVCMGTVSVTISSDCLLEEFISQWQHYFFSSYFSHLLGGKSPVSGNIVQLWKSLTGSNRKFPIKSLIKSGTTLKQLLS